MQRRVRLGAALGLVLTLLSASACETGTDPDVPVVPTTCGFTLVPGPVKHEDPDDQKPSWRELKGDIKRAAEVTNDFWSRHWSDCFSGAYTEPVKEGDELGLYDADNAPTCGDHTLDPLNAAFCGTEGWVAWGEPLMREGETYGDGLVYLVVAHEIGHAAQAQLPPADRATEQIEQQADCFAGAALEAENRETDFEWQVGDDNEAAASLLLLADKIAWTKVEKGESPRHGDALERIYAFQDGRVNGVGACFRIP